MNQKYVNIDGQWLKIEMLTFKVQLLLDEIYKDSTRLREHVTYHKIGPNVIMYTRSWLVLLLDTYM